mgnify:CR=1 FL=1
MILHRTNNFLQRVESWTRMKEMTHFQRKLQCCKTFWSSIIVGGISHPMFVLPIFFINSQARLSSEESDCVQLRVCKHLYFVALQIERRYFLLQFEFYTVSQPKIVLMMNGCHSVKILTHRNWQIDVFDWISRFIEMGIIIELWKIIGKKKLNQ